MLRLPVVLSSAKMPARSAWVAPEDPAHLEVGPPRAAFTGRLRRGGSASAHEEKTELRVVVQGSRDVPATGSKSSCLYCGSGCFHSEIRSLLPASNRTRL